VFLFVVLSFIKWGAAEKKSIIINGYEWAKWNNLMKVGFVMGWIRAVDTTLVPFVFPGFRGIRIDADTIRNLMEQKGLDIDNLTFGQIVDGVDQLYSDPRVKLWNIEEIMPILRGRLKGGWTEKDVDEVIAYHIKLKEIFRKHHDNLIDFEKMKKEYESLDARKPGVLKALEDY
jgi:hypothetical protein